MKLLIDDVKLNLLMEQKKSYIGKKVAWDSILSACSFLISVLFATYKDLWGISGEAFKIFFVMLGLFFTFKALYDVLKSVKNSYNYEDLLQDINKLNEITHNHSIVAIRDTFEQYPNRFLVYDDVRWKCKLFVNYKDNTNNESFIKDHLSRELKIDESKIKLTYIAQNISEKISGSDNVKKVYCHKLFLAEIEDMPENMRKDTFEADGRVYHWKSIVELEEDDEAMAKNADIIGFVKNNV
ncbi:MAG: hypothetical protein LUG52_10640 [Clostridia bacterium]|nr:hypothetical protein [Clostridia bacterium]